MGARFRSRASGLSNVKETKGEQRRICSGCFYGCCRSSVLGCSSVAVNFLYYPRKPRAQHLQVTKHPQYKPNVRSFPTCAYVVRINALGEPLPTKESSLKRPARPRPELTKKEDQQLSLPDRKIVVEPLEWCVIRLTFPAVVVLAVAYTTVPTTGTNSKHSEC